MLVMLREQARQATRELCDIARIQQGEIFVVGCSSSEALGSKIGSASSPEAAQAIFDGIWEVLSARGVFLAAQCCEHLGRALVISRAAAERYRLDIVNAVPQPKAGGSFAAAAWEHLPDRVLVDELRAQAAAGIDIGGTLIGMHLRRVAVPVRLSLNHIGEAAILCARTRPRFVGGWRAVYDETLV